MFTQSHTVLLITRQELARIDLTGRRRLCVKQFWTQPSCDYDSIVPAVSRALKLGTHRPSRITVVSPDFWTDVLSVPADVAAIANENEIIQALAFDAEVDSGLSAFESQTSAFRMPRQNEHNDDCPWCVTQVANTQLRELSSTLRATGARLHCIAHPVAAHLAVAECTSIDTIQELLCSWRNQSALNDDELAKLADDWAVCLTRTPKFPLLMTGEPESASSAQPIALTASLALFAAGGCGSWHWHTQARLVATTQSIGRLEKQQSQHEATEAAIKHAEASATQLRQEVVHSQGNRLVTERQLQLASATHSQHNRRWLALIDALAESAEENCWVQKIESNSVQTVVHGLALDNAAANSFAGRLEQSLKGSGWRTAPAATAVSPHNLIAFKIVLQVKLKPDERPVDSKISQSTPSYGSIAASNDFARGTEP